MNTSIYYLLNIVRTALLFALFLAPQTAFSSLSDDLIVTMKDLSKAQNKTEARRYFERAQKLIIDKGSKDSLNQEGDENWTPLTYASYIGNTALVKLLLEHGADPNQKAREDSTPLFYAAFKGQLSIAKLLVWSGAEVNSINNPEGKREWLPIHIASAAGQKGIVEFLIDRRADIHQSTGDGLTALDFASERGNGDLVTSLIKSGYFSHSAIDKALEIAQRNKHDDVANLIKEIQKYGYGIQTSQRSPQANDGESMDPLNTNDGLGAREIDSEDSDSSPKGIQTNELGNTPSWSTQVGLESKARVAPSAQKSPLSLAGATEATLKAKINLYRRAEQQYRSGRGSFTFKEIQVKEEGIPSFTVVHHLGHDKFERIIEKEKKKREVTKEEIERAKENVRKANHQIRREEREIADSYARKALDLEEQLEELLKHSTQNQRVDSYRRAIAPSNLGSQSTVSKEMVTDKNGASSSKSFVYRSDDIPVQSAAGR